MRPASSRRVALTVACVLSLALVGAVPAEADLAGCSNCIVAADVAANAIGLSEMASNSVGAAEIRTGNVGASEIATGAVGAAEIATGAVGTSELAFNPATQAELDARSPRVAAPSAATTTTIDPAGNRGIRSSVTIGTDGLAIVAHQEGTNADLHVTHCSNSLCSVATPTVLDSIGFVGREPSIAIGADGLALISYMDSANGNLKVAHCSNVTCSTATINPIDTAGLIGYESSITIGGDGLGLISYNDFDNTGLKVAHCADTACTAADALTLVESANEVGRWSSITTGVDGFGIISHLDNTNDAVRVTHCSNALCTAATSIALYAGNVDVDQFSRTSIAIDGNGLAVVAFQATTSNDLFVAHCTSVVCSNSATWQVDTNGLAGAYPALTIGVDGRPIVVSRVEDTGVVRVTHCQETCERSVTADQGAALTASTDPSVTITPEGVPMLMLRKGGSLIASRCANVFCAPYVRNR